MIDNLNKISGLFCQLQYVLSGLDSVSSLNTGARAVAHSYLGYLGACNMVLLKGPLLHSH